MDKFQIFPFTAPLKKWGLYLVDCGHEIVPAGYDVYPPQVMQECVNHHFDVHHRRYLEYYQLVYVKQGTGFYENESFPKVEVVEKSVFFVFPRVYCGLYPSQKTGWEIYWVSFCGDIARRLMQEPFFNVKAPVLHIDSSDAFEGTMKGFLDDLIDGQGFFRFPYSVSGQLLGILGQVHEMKAKTENVVRSEDEVRKAQIYISSHALERIDYSALAQRLGVSRRTFWRKFGKMMMTSPLQYQLELRLRHAERKLMETDMQVSEIAAECGFENVYYFSTLFTRKVGMSPAAYRKHVR